MSGETLQVKLAVLGAGPAGYPAAFAAADAGLEPLLIAPEENPGGVCLYRGCIPSKALLQTAELIERAREAEAIGLTFGPPKIDLDKVRAAARETVSTLTGGLGALSKARKIRHVRARAVFEDAHTLRLTPEAGADAPSRVVFEKLILAAGSKPVVLPGVPVCPEVWDSDRALELPEIPETLLVIGGGYIGLELGSVYAALGSRVTVAEAADTLLPGVDPDLVRPLKKRLGKLFAEIRTGAKVKDVERKKKGGLSVTFDGSDATVSFDRALVAVGRHPETAALQLEKAGIAADPRGFVTVDAAYRTSTPHVLAIGDVIGAPMLAHTGTRQAHVAVEVLRGADPGDAPRAYPAVIFTHPEIAWCGLTEKEAAGKDAVRVLKFPHSASGRARTLRQADGLTKLLVDADSGRILGAGITGPHAGELIAEAVLAIEMGATARDLAVTIHAHPTLSETLMEAAESFDGHAIHFMSKARK